MARCVGYLAIAAMCAALAGCRGPSEAPPTDMTYKIAVGMKLSAVLAMLADANAEDMCLEYDMKLSGLDAPIPDTVMHSGCYRLPDDQAVWLISLGPRNGLEERFVVTSISLGPADEFAKAGPQRDKFVKHRANELTMSNEGMIDFAPGVDSFRNKQD